ncbi:hypothetical protein MKX03_031543, partial [Papaver bracteatum]
MVAANCARGAFQSFTKSSSFASGAAKFGGFTFTANQLLHLLMPLHSVTASALLTSKLSLKAGNWAWLSEGY